VSAAGAPARPGRHRDPEVDRAILDAGLAVLREHGYQRFTMSAVIERAGVSSATLYRRWPTRQALVAAVVESMVVTEVDCDTGSLAGDLAAFVHARVEAIGDEGPFLEALQRELVDDLEVDEAMRERIIDPAVREMGEILRRAVDRGEIGPCGRPADVELSLVLGPLHHRSMVLRQSLDPAFERAVVDQAVAGLRTAAQGARRRADPQPQPGTTSSASRR
jgi:AcrR family transcriptional regulator